MKRFLLAAALAAAAAADAGAATNTWVRKAGTDAKASNPANWSLKRVPKKSDVVLFSRRASNAAVWDAAAPREVAGWIQEEGYVAVITLETSPKGPFRQLEVEGDVAILGGALTHPQNGASADWWLRIRAGGSITVGPEAIVSASGKGFAPGKGPSPGLAPGFGASHGGQGAPKNMADPAGVARCPGSIFEPSLSGSGGWGPEGREAEGPHGGGSIRLEAGGDILLRGPVRADADSLSERDRLCGGAAGGSIWLVAGGDVKLSWEAGGRLSANGGEAFAGRGGGGGGRIAIYAGAEKPDVVDSIWWCDNRRAIVAFGGTGETGSRDDTNRDRHIRAASGTIYTERTGPGRVPRGGRILVYNGVRPSLAYTRIPSDEGDDADATRDAELYLAGNAAGFANGSFPLRLLGFTGGGSLDLAGGTVTVGAVFSRGDRARPLDDPGTHRESDDARLDPVLFNGGRLVVTPYFPPVAN